MKEAKWSKKEIKDLALALKEVNGGKITDLEVGIVLGMLAFSYSCANKGGSKDGNAN